MRIHCLSCLQEEHCAVIRSDLFPWDYPIFTSAAELRKRLGEELKYESENDAAKPDSQYIEDYTSKSSWKIEEVFGSKYVKFIKNRGKNK